MSAGEWLVEIQYADLIPEDGIWPDCDGPENPTDDDVRAVILAEINVKGFTRFVRDWDLCHGPAYVLVNGVRMWRR